MQQEGPQNPYEVYCFACKVSAPVGLRRCLHCGGRLTGRKDQKGAIHPITLEEETALDSPPSRLGGASPATALWILLLIGGSLYRLCG
jgi:hypothetical protein